MKKIILGGGCFWCVEAVYRRVKGVESAVSGYAGGNYPNPTYEMLHKIETGHAEVVEVSYSQDVISLEKILEIFWHIHDPTTPNRQGNDVGPEYRSAIYYFDDSDATTIRSSVENTAKKIWDMAIVTEIKKVSKFYPAEEYHQDYFTKNPNQGYCQLVINPKVRKFEETFSEQLL